MVAAGKPLKRVKRIKTPVVGRWRGYTKGDVVILTTTGQLWQREGTLWRLRQGMWTTKKVESWAASAGFLRVGEPGTTPFGKPIDRAHTLWLTKGRAMPDITTSASLTRRCKSVAKYGTSSRCAGPVLEDATDVPGAYARDVFPPDQLAARLDAFAERAAKRLPLFEG